MSRSNAVLVAEFLGTFLLTGAVLFGANPFIVLAILVLLIGAISGAHVNPAVSAGLASIGRLDVATMVKYWVVQVLGALVARVAYAYLMSNEVTLKMSMVKFDSRAFVAELIGGAIFLLGVTLALGRKLEGLRLAAAVGGSLLLGAMFGGSINPAVMFGSESLSLATVLGALVGAVIGAQAGSMLTEAANRKK